MQRYLSEPLRLPSAELPSFASAYLEFEGVEKRGASFVLQVFVGNSEAAENTPRDITHGFAGTLPVFGHGECWGDVGHCDVPQGPQDAFDQRTPHALLPVNLTLEITDALRFLGAIEEVVVSVLAYEADPEADERDQILRFSQLTLVTYD